MSEWTPSEKDVRNAWRKYRGDHDFRQIPVLKLPLYKPMAVIQDFKQMSDAVMLDHRTRIAEYKIESGFIDGKRMTRIVGTVPGTDVFVVVAFSADQ